MSNGQQGGWPPQPGGWGQQPQAPQQAPQYPQAQPGGAIPPQQPHMQPGGPMPPQPPAHGQPGGMAPPQPPQHGQPPPQFQQPPQFQPPPQGFAPQQGYPPQQQMPQQGYPPQQGQPNFQMNPFAGLTTGDQSAQRLPYLLDGSYLLNLDTMRLKPARTGKQLYIIEFFIEQSDNPQRPPGMKCSAFIDLSNVNMKGVNASRFVSAVYGYDPTQLPKDSSVAPWVDPQTNQQMGWDHYMGISIHDSQPWRGVKVGCRAETVLTQAGKPFTAHYWTPASMTVVGAPAQAAPTPGGAPAQTWSPPQQGGGWQGGPQHG